MLVLCLVGLVAAGNPDFILPQKWTATVSFESFSNNWTSTVVLHKANVFVDDGRVALLAMNGSVLSVSPARGATKLTYLPASAGGNRCSPQQSDDSTAPFLGIFDLNATLGYPWPSLATRVDKNRYYFENSAVFPAVQAFVLRMGYFEVDVVANNVHVNLTLGEIGPPTVVVSTRTNLPLYQLRFANFSTYDATFPPTHAFDLPACAPPRAPPLCPNGPASAAMTVVRQVTSDDAHARSLANTNAATFAGEAYFLLTFGGNADLVAASYFALWSVAVDARFGSYLQCNRGRCSDPASPRAPSDFQSVGLGGRDRVCKLSLNASAVTWFSFPDAAFCERGAPLGTNNCTVGATKLLKLVSGRCVLGQSSLFLFPFEPTTEQAAIDKTAHLLKKAMQACPDLSRTALFNK